MKTTLNHVIYIKQPQTKDKKVNNEKERKYNNLKVFQKQIKGKKYKKNKNILILQ